MNDLEKAIKDAKKPGGVRCPECSEEYFSPMEKLSIGLYGTCSDHLEENGYKERNLLKIAEAMF